VVKIHYLVMNSQAPRGLVAVVVIPIALLLRRIIIDWHGASAVETGNRTERADALVGGLIFPPDR
jgi:hypothetical protein